MEERIGLVEGLAADQTFLGQPIWVAQRWADSGMPVTREGRYGLCLTRRTEPLTGTRICRGAVPVRNSNGGLSYVPKQSRLGLRKRRRPKLTGRALVWVQMRGAAVSVLMMSFD